MARKYSSRRRTESAEHTRQSIVEAAVKMHEKGITTLSAVAEEAGVSLPTVNKYFPTREDLFTACTGHVADTLDYPSPEALAAIEDRGERIQQLVEAVYTLHEETFGTAWTGYKLEDESPVMAQAMIDYENFIGVLVESLLHDWEGKSGTPSSLSSFIRGLLNPLTYRAIRLKNGLNYEEAVRHTVQALTCMLAGQAGF